MNTDLTILHKRKLKTIILVTLLLGVGLNPLFIVKADPITIYVDDDNTTGPWDGTETNPYQRIQDAVDNATEHDSIIVKDGTYIENIIITTHNLSIQSENGAEFTFVQASDPSDHVFIIQADDITLSGFTITNATDYDCYGVYCDTVNHVILEENSIIDNHIGIYLDTTTQSIIRDNFLQNNSQVGLKTRFSTNNTIINNLFIENCKESDWIDAAIYLESSHHNTITQNACLENGYETEWGDSRFGWGIKLSNSNDNSISMNQINENFVGAIFLQSSTDTDIIDNDCSNNGGITTEGFRYGTGIEIEGSEKTLLENNRIEHNSQYGLYILFSTDAVLSDNQLNDNYLNFHIQGFEDSEYFHTIDQSNTINDKPIFYLTNISDQIISTDAGFIGIINGENITLKDMTLTDNGRGILLINTTYSTIENITMFNNTFGMYLLNSHENFIHNCSVLNNSYAGVYLTSSHNNTLKSNVIKDHYELYVWDYQGTGVYLSGSNSNVIIETIFLDNYAASKIKYSEKNIITHCTFKNNTLGLDGSSENQITHNNMSESSISLRSSSDNNHLANNTIVDGSIRLSSLCSYNVVENNNLSGIGKGLDLYRSRNNQLIKNYIYNKNEAIYLNYQSRENLIKDNILIQNNYGIYIYRGTSTSNHIYNNYFNNTNNAFSESNNIWNTTKILGTNIIGGPYIGGNYWSDYAGEDLTGDGLGDENIPYDCDGAMGAGGDYLPLVQTAENPPQIISIDPTSPVENTEKESRMFSIIADQEVTVTWSINDETCFQENDVTSSTYLNTSAVTGVWTVKASIENENGMDSTEWQWIVSSLPNPEISSINPLSPVESYEGQLQTFSIEIDQIVDVEWKINDTFVFSETSIQTSSYANDTALEGSYQVEAIVSNENGTDSYSWIWNVSVNPPPQIISKTPSDSVVYGSTGSMQTFSVSLDQPANITWLINGEIQEVEEMVDTSSFQNTSIQAGIVTFTVYIENQFGVAFHDWDWVVYDTMGIQNINTSKTFLTLQDAIDDTDTLIDHLIIVDPGMYYENVFVDKQVQIRSSSLDPSETVINAVDPEVPVFTIQENDVIIDSLSIKGASSLSSSGILLDGVTYTQISNNSISDCFYGFYLKNSHEAIIEHNIVSTNQGITLNGSSHNRLYSNSIQSCLNDGLRLFDSHNNSIITNQINNNNGDGVLQRNSHYNIFEQNDISGNSDSGLDLDGSSNNSINYNTIIDNNHGIWFFDSVHNSIDDNDISDNSGYGARIRGSAYLQEGHHRVTNNTVNGNRFGLDLDGAPYSIVSNNLVTSNTHNGMRIYHSENSEILNNTIHNNGRIGNDFDYGLMIDVYSSNTLVDGCVLNNNSYNLGVAGSNYMGMSELDVEHYDLDIRTTNTVEGKPVYYYLDEQDITVPTDAGYVGLINCSNMTLEDITCTKNVQSVLVVNTIDSHIRNCSFDKDFVSIRLIGSNENTLQDLSIVQSNWGIQLINSSINTIRNNTMSQSGRGIYISDTSDQNNVEFNIVSLCNYSGITVYASSSNLIQQNQIYNGYQGISLILGVNNHINMNNVTDCDDGIISGGVSTHHIFTNNVIIECEYGLDINDDDCIIQNNTFTNNSRAMDISGNNCLFKNNTLVNNAQGIRSISSIGTIFIDNRIENSTHEAVRLWKTKDTIFSKNKISTSHNGLFFKKAKNCTLTENELINNTYNLIIEHESYEDLYHEIDDSNLINDLPIKYLINETDTILEGPIGFVACINCTNITIKNAELSNNSHAILLYNTNESQITNLTMINNTQGMELTFSNNNTLNNSIIEHNSKEGLYLYDSHRNLIYNNIINNLINVFDNGNNTYNITKTIRSNCVGGDYLGGNYWNNYQGIDNDADGLGDTFIPYNSSYSIMYQGDYHPLIPMDHDHDIYIPMIDVADSVSVNSIVSVNATISNNGRFDETDVLIEFYVDEELMEVKTIDIDAKTYENVEFDWLVPEYDLFYELRVRANAVPGETHLDNNEIIKTVEAYAITDIIVEQITWSPVNMSDGENVEFSAQIRNIGENATYRTFVASFYVDDQFIGSQKINGLNVNETLTITRQWISDPEKTTIRVYADSTNMIPETNTINNNKTRSFVIGKADLLILSVTWEPSDIIDGEVISFQAAIENIGSSTMRRFTVRFFMDGNKIGEKRINGLSSGSLTQIDQVWLADAGNHTLEIIVDATDVVIEGNEENNLYTQDFENIARSDLIVTDISWADDEMFVDGNIIQINATIANIGEGNTSQRFHVAFQIDDEEEIPCGCGDTAMLIVVEGLAAGETKTITGTWMATAGPHQLRVIVDSDDDVVESNETNNNMTVMLPEIPSSDLVITDITPTSDVLYAGDIVTFNLSYENIGSGDLILFTGIKFSIDDQMIFTDFIPGLASNETKMISLDGTESWIATAGDHTLTAEIDFEEAINEEDETNNVFSKTITVIDNTPPTVTIIPGNNSIKSFVPKIHVMLLDEYGSGVDYDQTTLIVRNHTGQEIPGLIQVHSNGKLEFTPDDPFVDDHYHIDFSSTDFAGNEVEVDFVFTVDTVKPFIMVAHVSEDEVYTHTVSPVINVYDDNLETVQILLNDQPFTSGSEIIFQGSYTLTVEAIDGAGHTSVHITNFSIDLSPAAPTGLMIHEQLTKNRLEWNDNTEEDLAGYNVYRDGVKLNSEIVIHSFFEDEDISMNESYEYTISAVDDNGQESEQAGVQQVEVELVNYGIETDETWYLTKEMVDTFKINLTNVKESSVLVSDITFELTDEAGVSLYVDTVSDFSLASSQIETIEKTVFIPANTHRLRLSMSFDGVASSRYFTLNLRDPPTPPVLINPPVILEGYADEIEIIVCNHGSASIHLNQDDIHLILLDEVMMPLSFGGGNGGWIEIPALQQRILTTYLVTPMAVGYDIHLHDLNLSVNLTTYYGESYGKYLVMDHHLVEIITNRYVTVPALELYHSTLTADSTQVINLRFINQGTATLDIKQEDAQIRLLDENGTLIIQKTSTIGSETVLSGCTLNIPITLDLPVDIPERVTIVAEINASCEAKANHATEAFYIIEKTVETQVLPYDADATTDKTIYGPAEPVHITGIIQDNDGEIVPDEIIKIRLSSEGFYREYYALSDENGVYSFTFTPLSNEAGRYVVSASHPDASHNDNDCEFEILGLFIDNIKTSTPYPTPNPSHVYMLQTDTVNASVVIRNTGESNLEDITVYIDDKDPSDDIIAVINTPSFDLLPKEKKTILITLTANDTDRYAADFEVFASCNPDIEVSTDLFVTLDSITPSVFFSQNHIQTGIKPGKATTKSVEVWNVGFAPLLNASISLPNISWIHLPGGQEIGDIAEDSFYTIDVFIQPYENVSTGIYEDEIIITSDNYVDLIIPIYIIVTSEELGSIAFDVINQLDQHLPGAVITLIDQETGTLSFTAKTDSEGNALFSNIPVGRYSYSMFAENHYDIFDTIVVESGIVKETTIYTTYSFMQYEWYVIETEIEDVYDIVHNITYDTQAPLPYLKIDEPEFSLFMMKGATYHGQFNVTNMADIVSALNVTPAPQISSELVTIEFLVDNIPEIKPHETVTIPYIVKLAEHHSPQAVACEPVKISIPLKSESNCVYCIYFDDPSTGRTYKLYCHYERAITDSLNFEISPGCYDFMKSGISCAMEILEYKTGVKIVIDAGNLIKFMANIKEAYGTIKSLANCFTAQYCNAWPALDCASDIYGFFKLPFSNCLKAAKDLAKCMFQDECCGKELEESELQPRIMPPGGYIIPRVPAGNWGLYGVHGKVYKGPCSKSPTTMCIQARLSIPQEQILERQAFNANLRLYNIMPDYDMFNVSVQMNITDTFGDPAEDIFYVDVSLLDNLDTLEDGYINANDFADIQWFFIPTPGAGGNESLGRDYKVQAYVEYTVNGKKFSFETYPETISVRPMPKLTLDYMLPRNVYGDDPMTQGIIEPVIPFMWGVRVRNDGYGPAYNLKIDSAQPEIIEQTSGAHLSFQLLGAYLDGEQTQESLNIDFGDINAGESSTAGWKMISSVSGKFSNYTASFTHSDTLGGMATSLIKEINTHVLIHEFINDLPGRDNMYDFLIDTTDDGYPDFIIDSEGNDEPVTYMNSTIVGYPTLEDPTITVKINKTSASDWVYTTFVDPLDNNVSIVQIIRIEDGKILSDANYWFDNGNISFVDDPDTEYEITYDLGDEPEPSIHIENITINPTTPTIGFPVNITCTVIADAAVSFVQITITNPDKETTIQQMNHSTESTYYHNTTFDMTETYNFTIYAEDIHGNHAVSPLFNITFNPVINTNEIWNIDDLYDIRNNLSGTYLLMKDLDFQNNDDYIDWMNSKEENITGQGWLPIGGSSNRFTGIFDGQGYTISNLYINRSISGSAGLFGFVNGSGEVLNLGVINADIICSHNSGGLVGWNEGNIQNCYFSGSIDGDSSMAGNLGSFIGGLVGWNKGTVKDCYATGGVQGHESIGGLIGENDQGIVENSYATGEITGNYNVGGLVGRNYYSTVNDSFATGNVSGSSGVGGLIGNNYQSLVENSYATGNAIGNRKVGGLIGENIGTVHNSYARGDVTRRSGSLDEIIGGFCGKNYQGQINTSYSMGSVYYEDDTDPSDKGFIGIDDSGSYLENFYDAEASNQATATGATPKTTEEMKDINTFSSWDIANSETNLNDGYPYLGWQDDDETYTWLIYLETLQCSPDIDLPEEEVTLLAWEFPGHRLSAYEIELVNIPSGYNLTDGMYDGWCIDYGTPIPNGEPQTVDLYSSYDPPEHLIHENWSRVNYLINHVPVDADPVDVQRAIYHLINLGPWSWDYTGYGPMGDVVNYDMVNSMIDEAVTNVDEGWCPGCGDRIAVICDPGTDHDFQITFIEVVLCEENPLCCSVDIDLPEDDCTLLAWEFPEYRPSAYELELTGIIDGYMLTDGKYDGWCIDYGTPIPNGEPQTVDLYSSYDPPEHLIHENWSRMNYLINHVPVDADPVDVQRAIYHLINLGPWSWDYTGYGPMGDVVNYDMVNSMIDEAVTNVDEGWCPGCGDRIAVICDPGTDHDFQITFIEVVLCSENPVETENEPSDDVGTDDSSETVAVDIINQAPIATATVDVTTGNPGLVCSFDASDSYDADGDIVLYTWNFDDGPHISTDEETITHLFDSVGIYQVMLTVKDENGETGSLDEPLIIEIIQANTPPENLTVTAETTLTQKNTTVSFTMSAFDPDSSDTLRFEIDWADGTTFVSDHIYESNETFTKSHQWDTYGVYNVSITSYDNYNASTALFSLMIHVDVLVIDDEINGWLIDTDSDTVYDSFLNTSNGVNTKVEQKTDGSYLIDINNDGVMNYLFDVHTSLISKEIQEIPEESDETLSLLLLGGFFLFFIGILLIGFIIYQAQQQSKKSTMTKQQKAKRNP